MTTRQMQYMTPPKLAQKDLAITIRCGGCRTLRTFKVSLTLERVTQRVDSGFGIETRCLACGLDLGVTLFWTGPESGWSYKDPRDAYEGEIHVITDDASMERKAIG